MFLKAIRFAYAPFHEVAEVGALKTRALGHRHSHAEGHRDQMGRRVDDKKKFEHASLIGRPVLKQVIESIFPANALLLRETIAGRCFRRIHRQVLFLLLAAFVRNGEFPATT